MVAVVVAAVTVVAVTVVVATVTVVTVAVIVAAVTVVTVAVVGTTYRLIHLLFSIFEALLELVDAASHITHNLGKARCAENQQNDD